VKQKPYEINIGETEKIYNQAIRKLEHCIEKGSKGLRKILLGIVNDFRNIEIDKSTRKPVVAVLGEIFMRDNAGCNGISQTVLKIWELKW